MSSAENTRPPGDDRTSSDAPPTRALDWVVPSKAVDLVYEEVAAQLRRRRRRRHRLTGFALAGVMMLIGAGWWQIREPAPALKPMATSIVSAPVRQVLSDGSVIELNQGALITVDFSDAVRRVRLQRGEAHFQVAKDTARPFIVIAGAFEVRAVGTAFNVDLGSSAVEVLVTEGEVAVEKIPEPAPLPTTTLPSPSVKQPAPQTLARLAAGTRVTVDLSLEAPAPLAVVPVSPVETSQRLAWRAPRVDFSGTSLKDVVAVFNQYSGVRISIGDPKLAEIELSGVLRSDNVDSLLQLLADEFKIVAVRQADEIVLHGP